MNTTYKVTAAVDTVRTFSVTAASPARAAALIAEGEEVLDGEKVEQWKDYENGYDIVDVEEISEPPELILNAAGQRITQEELGPFEQGFTLDGRRRRVDDDAVDPVRSEA